MGDRGALDEASLRKIFIGGLSYSTDDDKLRKYFSTYGLVQDAVVMKDPVSRRSRGFGFITFVEFEALDRALEAEPHTIDGRKVRSYAPTHRFSSSSLLSCDAARLFPNTSPP